VSSSQRSYGERDARSQAVTAATDAGGGRSTPASVEDSEDVTIIDAVGGSKRDVQGAVKTLATNVAGRCATPPGIDGFEKVTKKDAVGGVEHKVRCPIVLPDNSTVDAPSAPPIRENGEDVPTDTAAGDAFSHGGAPLLACKSEKPQTFVAAACDAERSPRRQHAARLVPSSGVHSKRLGTVSSPTPPTRCTTTAHAVPAAPP